MEVRLESLLLADYWRDVIRIAAVPSRVSFSICCQSPRDPQETFAVPVMQRRVSDADSTGRCNTLMTARAEGVLQMKQRPRIYYTDSQKTLMWERWRRGESQQQIAQLFDRNHSSIYRILAETGGIQPRTRCRSRHALSLAEREEISRGLVAGNSIRSIAPSGISDRCTCEASARQSLLQDGRLGRSAGR